MLAERMRKVIEKCLGEGLGKEECEKLLREVGEEKRLGLLGAKLGLSVD